jgi:hypothetical protein
VVRGLLPGEYDVEAWLWAGEDEEDCYVGTASGLAAGAAGVRVTLGLDPCDEEDE